MPTPKQLGAPYRAPISTLVDRHPAPGTHEPQKDWVRTSVAVLLWVMVWQGAALILDQPILLSGPWDVLIRLVELAPTVDFWASVGTTVARIAAGFASAVIIGAVLAVIATQWRWLDAIIAVPIATIRATPVVSFIILVLVWTGTSWLAATVAFLMALPVMHTTTAEGIRRRDLRLAEMADVFQVPWPRRFIAIDLPQVLPFVMTAARTAIGLSWKAGVAAEVIGLPQGSIGERLYQAKLSLATADVFAWTIVVVAAAAVMEAIVVRLLRMTRQVEVPK